MTMSVPMPQAQSQAQLQSQLHSHTVEGKTRMRTTPSRLAKSNHSTINPAGGKEKARAVARTLFPDPSIPLPTTTSTSTSNSAPTITAPTVMVTRNSAKKATRIATTASTSTGTTANAQRNAVLPGGGGGGVGSSPSKGRGGKGKEKEKVIAPGLGKGSVTGKGKQSMVVSASGLGSLQGSMRSKPKSSSQSSSHAGGGGQGMGMGTGMLQIVPTHRGSGSGGSTRLSVGGSSIAASGSGNGSGARPPNSASSVGSSSMSYQQQQGQGQYQAVQLQGQGQIQLPGQVSGQMRYRYHQSSQPTNQQQQQRQAGYEIVQPVPVHAQRIQAQGQGSGQGQVPGQGQYYFLAQPQGRPSSAGPLGNGIQRSVSAGSGRSTHSMISLNHGHGHGHGQMHVDPSLRSLEGGYGSAVPVAMRQQQGYGTMSASPVPGQGQGQMISPQMQQQIPGYAQMQMAVSQAQGGGEVRPGSAGGGMYAYPVEPQPVYYAAGTGSGMGGQYQYISAVGGGMEAGGSRAGSASASGSQNGNGNGYRLERRNSNMSSVSMRSGSGSNYAYHVGIGGMQSGGEPAGMVGKQKFKGRVPSEAGSMAGGEGGYPDETGSDAGVGAYPTYPGAFKPERYRSMSTSTISSIPSNVSAIVIPGAKGEDDDKSGVKGKSTGGGGKKKGDNSSTTTKAILLYPHLRPGDTVIHPSRPNQHGCPYCNKIYHGQHARSICRRHQQSKHGIELDVQVKKSRWDSNPNRPANDEEKHKRTLESKRRWAAKDRQRRKAEKYGLPMPASDDEEEEAPSTGPSSASVKSAANAPTAAPAAASKPLPGNRMTSGSSKLRSVSGPMPSSPYQPVPPPPSEEERQAAMARIRNAGQPQPWQQAPESDSEGEDDDTAPIQEEDIEVDPPIQRQPQSMVSVNMTQSGPSSSRQPPYVSQAELSRMHPGFQTEEQKQQLRAQYQSYRPDFPQVVEPSKQNIDPDLSRPAGSSSIPPAPIYHQQTSRQPGYQSEAQMVPSYPAMQRLSSRPSMQRVSSGNLSAHMAESRPAGKRNVSQPLVPQSNRLDVFGMAEDSRMSAAGSLQMLADTTAFVTPLTSANHPSLGPSQMGSMPPPAMREASSMSTVDFSDRPPLTGPDNEEAAEILLAISASPAAPMRKAPAAELPVVGGSEGGLMRHAITNATAGQGEGVESARRPSTAEERDNGYGETPSRPSGYRSQSISDRTPGDRLWSIKSRATSSAQRTPSEFAVPELRPASVAPSSSYSRRHEDSPITPAELQPAADILPYAQRMKPPAYGKGDVLVAEPQTASKPEMSSPTGGNKVPAPTPTPKTSALRSGLSTTTFGGYTTKSSIITPARPTASGTNNSSTALPRESPADFRTFSSPDGLDLTHHLGLAPQPVVPESPDWLAMVRGTPDVRKRGRGGQGQGEEGGEGESPRKRVRV